MDPIRIDHLPQAAPLHGVKLYEQPAFTMPWHMHDFFELARGKKSDPKDVIMKNAAPYSLILMLTLVHVGVASERNQQNQQRRGRFTFEQFSTRHEQRWQDRT